MSIVRKGKEMKRIVEGKGGDTKQGKYLQGRENRQVRDRGIFSYDVGLLDTVKEYPPFLQPDFHSLTKLDD